LDQGSSFPRPSWASRPSDRLTDPPPYEIQCHAFHPALRFVQSQARQYGVIFGVFSRCRRPLPAVANPTYQPHQHMKLKTPNHSNAAKWLAAALAAAARRSAEESRPSGAATLLSPLLHQFTR
jgi:hypothetical protein